MKFLIVLLCGAGLSYVVGRVTPALTNLPASPSRRARVAVVLLGAGWALLVTATLGVSWTTLKWYLLAAWLLAITLSDVVGQLIPDRLTYSGTLIGITAAALVPGEIAAVGSQWILPPLLGLPDGPISGVGLSLLGALVGFSVVDGFRRAVGIFAGRPVMGMGDSKLVMLLGSFLGPFMVLLALVPSLAAGVIIGPALKTLARTPYFPFGPALALGGLMTGLYPNAILEALAWSVRLFQMAGVAATIVIEVLLLMLVAWLLWRLRTKAARTSEFLDQAYANETRRVEEEPDKARRGDLH